MHDQNQLELRTRSNRSPYRFLRFAAIGFMALLLAVMLAPSGANAQLAGKGAIAGTVTDSTGAVVPGATVAATSEATGITTKTVSTGTGDYHFPALDPGIYTVTATAKGFETLVQKNIHVNA